MHGVFRFSTDLSPGAGKYTEKSGTGAIATTKSARTHRKSPARGNHPAIARRCRQNAYVTLSPPTAMDSTRPQLGHYFSNYNFRCAFRIHENAGSCRCRINPRTISPGPRNIYIKDYPGGNMSGYFHMQEVRPAVDR